MRIGIVYNIASVAATGYDGDLASDKEMELIPSLVAHELVQVGHSVCMIPADWNLGSVCKTNKVDIAFNLAEGFAGTNGHEHIVPSILEFHQIPYTGADATNMLTLRDKLFTKEILRANGVCSPNHHLFVRNGDAISRDLKFPLILKPVREEASLGISFSSVVSCESELRTVLTELLARYCQPILAEEYIHGREISLGVWGNALPEVLPEIEFQFEDVDTLRRFRSFEYKWLGGQEKMVRPYDLTESMLSEARQQALLAHNLLRCRDYSRADFRVSNDGVLYFLEHNFNPGIGPNTYGLSNTFTMMAEYAGISFGAMLGRLLAIAMERYK